MEQDERHITVIDEDGNEQLYEVLFTYESKEFGKSYVFYYPVGAEYEDDEETDIHVCSYIPGEDGNEGQLQSIETKEEWDMIEEVWDKFCTEQEEEEEEE